MKKIIIILVIISILTLASCKSNKKAPDVNNTCGAGFHLVNLTCEKDEDTTPIVEVLGNSEGLEDVEIIKGRYFNPLKDVSVTTSTGSDITHLLHVEGYVNYGAVGNYTLRYTLDFVGETIDYTRTVTVKDGSLSAIQGARPSSIGGITELGEGSYYVGGFGGYDQPMNPTFIEKDLFETAVPSSGWWTSLLVENYGGMNGIYTNPLRISYTNEGMEITNPQDGFVQYWNVNQVQTMAQFPISLKDTFLKSTDLNSGYETKVISYGDSHVKVAMRNNNSSIDHMVTTLVQGSPYVFVEVANKDSLYYTFDVNGVDNYEYYDIDGNLITDSTYTGSAITVKMVHRHSGYDTSLPANVGSPQYSDKYYLINAPDNTTFTISSNNHPFGLKNKLSMSLGNGNYISIAAINNLDEVEYYNQHGYSFINDTDISYDVNYETNKVTTEYNYSVQNVKSDNAYNALIALMPHHYKNSDVTTSSYSFRTVRGTLKVLEDKTFTTVLSFNGLLPGFTTPNNTEFSNTTAVSYLEDLDSRINIADTNDFINAEGPYWNSKAIYPLSQGIIIADQLGETILRDSFIEKLKYVLEDWYTYSNAEDEKFLFYNNQWGTVFYSNNDFGTAAELSDHSFTHGYLIYASSILAMYDNTFVTEYGDMVDLLLNDYMYPIKDDPKFEYLRNFDSFAGHSWAHGFGTFAEGNNLESTSEALNSWNGGYLWSLATGDQDRMDASIYGFVTELSSVKEYWFDYDETNWDPAYGDHVDVAGIVWGGKHDYATWFGANPTFIYGIQWLPTGEYLTNYAMNDVEFTKLSGIYTTYLEAKGGEVDTWYTNMWAIQSIINPVTALSNFDETKILGDDYPNELVGSYWMINSLASLNRRTADVWMGINNNVAASVYESETGNYVAMLWNPTNSIQTVIFYDTDGIVLTYTIEANTFEKVNINE